MDSRSAPQTEAIMNLAKGDPSLYVNNDGEGPISAEWMIPKVKSILRIFHFLSVFLDLITYRHFGLKKMSLKIGRKPSIYARS